MALSSNVNDREFKFRRSGTYTNQGPLPRPRHKMRYGPRRDAGTGPVCPSCGLTRSCANRCDCNS